MPAIGGRVIITGRHAIGGGGVLCGRAVISDSLSGSMPAMEQGRRLVGS